MSEPLHWTHHVRDLPAGGLSAERAVTTEERARLAAELAVLSVEAARLTYRLTPRAGGRIALSGRLSAALTQACVVSLDPVPGTLEVDLDVVFVPDATTPATELEGTSDDLEQPDEEPIENGVLDIGRIVTEELISGLDPYPRAEGAALERADAGDKAPESPFAALRQLARRDDKDGTA